jgi:toxin secretion/phage lysis holin
VKETKDLGWNDAILASFPALVTLSGHFQRLDWLAQSLIVLALANTLAGGLNAVSKKKFQVAKMRQGGVRRLCIALIVAVFAYIEYATKSRVPLKDAVIAFYCAHEGIGFLRNIRSLGVPIPRVVTDWFSMLESMGEQAGSKPTAPPALSHKE